VSAASGGYTTTVLASGGALGFTKPDDLTAMDGAIFTAYQNGIGPNGEAAPNGEKQSAVVGYGFDGSVLNTWRLTGKVDGLTADPELGVLIATVNEDGNSSLYTIQPGVSGAAGVTHYMYDQTSLAHGGGTDAISIYQGQILISASAPSPAPADVPAVYLVQLAGGVAHLTSFFSDEATATVANAGASGQVQLALTDPDSNAVVPFTSPRFGGDFVLDSQGDQQQIYVRGLSPSPQTMSVLNLTQSVDDTQWITKPAGTLYATDPTANEIVAVQGDFDPGTAFTSATPGDANNAPPNPGPNFLATLDLQTGAVTAVPGLTIQPVGLLYVPRSERHHQNGQGQDQNGQGQNDQ
jgi:hypothetical protein